MGKVFLSRSNPKKALSFLLEGYSGDRWAGVDRITLSSFGCS